MATAGKTTLLLGLVLTALVVAAAAASVTIYNPATLVVDITPVGDGGGSAWVDEDDVVRVSTVVTTVNLTSSEQDIQIKTDDGHVMDVHVQDGDVLVLIPDPDGDGGLAFKVLLHPAGLSVVPPSPK